MRRSRRAVLRSALGIALAAAVFVVVVPRIASYRSVGKQLETVSAPWAIGLAAAVVLDVLTTALPWRALLPQLSWVGALGFTQASTALTFVLPGGAPLGMAISFGLLRRLRVTAGAAGFAVALTGIWSQVMILLYPLVGAALVFASGNLSGSTAAIAGASAAAGAIIAVLAFAVLRSPRAALWVGDSAGRLGARVARSLRRRPPEWSGEALVRVRAERVTDLRRRWPALTAATLGNQLTAYLIFELSLRAVGVSIASLPLSESFLAWAIGRVISSLPLTPGGIGVVELGMIGTLVGFGAPHAHVVAAVLLYRALVIVPTLVVGGIALVRFRVWAPSAAQTG
ncbi:MAG TPA: lysylphosphatidylglycerol synthase transmembrane domain-containing protein [Gaiellaceae bacterium]|nr:lysylphosphatidylglycerol synthase transmembrane domain-containing protein [Gaiellaceae bacterium]